MFLTFCPPTISTISLEFYRKPSILAADDLLGACYRKAMTPKKLRTLLFPQLIRLQKKRLFSPLYKETKSDQRKTLFDPKVTPINLTPEKETFFPFCIKRPKSDQRKTQFDPQSDSQVTFGAQKVTFESLLSLITTRGRKSLLSQITDFVVFLLL